MKIDPILKTVDHMRSSDEGATFSGILPTSQGGIGINLSTMVTGSLLVATGTGVIGKLTIGTNLKALISNGTTAVWTTIPNQIVWGMSITSGAPPSGFSINRDNNANNSNPAFLIANTNIQNSVLESCRINTGTSSYDHTSLYLTGTRQSVYIGDTVAPAIKTNKLYSVAGHLVRNTMAIDTVYTPGPDFGIGYINIPQQSISAAYLTVFGDMGTHLFHPATDNNPRTFMIDSNANIVYPIGTTITFINLINILTIDIASDSLIMAGSGATGPRTLAANGIATAIKIATTKWMISGTNLT